MKSWNNTPGPAPDLEAAQAEPVYLPPPPPGRKPGAVLRDILAPYLTLPFMMWLGLWFGINTGPWAIHDPSPGLLGQLHALRALFPLIVLAACGFLGSGPRTGSARTALPTPLKFWAAYGIIGLAAGFMTPASIQREKNLFDTAYWALAYLAVLACTWTCLQGPRPIENAIRLNIVSWVVAAGFLVALVVAARGSLMVGSGLEASGYGVVDRVGTVAEMPMSRSTGLARFAAVPAALCFVMVWRRPGMEKALWAAAGLAAGALVYVMQSRGSIMGLGVAIAVALIFLGKRARVLGFCLLVLFLLAAVMDLVPERVIAHLTRKYTTTRLGLLTGRTRAWKHAWEFIVQSPLWGWGMQADRELIREHVHNTYLYGLLAAGFAGAALFVAGLAAAWRSFIHVARQRLAERRGELTVFVQAGAVLAFFTVRGGAEVSGTLFGIDLMLMVPAIAYLGLLQAQQAPAGGPQPR